MPLHSALVFTPHPHPPLATVLAESITRPFQPSQNRRVTPPSNPSLTLPVSSHYNPVSSSLRVVRVRGDGRCLYRAIAKGIADKENRRLPESLEREDADALRNMAWKTMCVDRRHEFEKNNAVEGNLHQYCSAMRNPTFYAGEAEMLALSQVLRIPIRVYLRTAEGIRNIITYGDKWKGEGVRVLYVNGNHYDAILSR